MAPPPPPPRFPGINPAGTERSFAAHWKEWLDENSAAAEVPITKIVHMKNFEGSKVDHEFLVITVTLPEGQPVRTQQIVAERQTSSTPDQLIYGTWETSTAMEKHRWVAHINIDIPHGFLIDEPEIRKAVMLGRLEFNDPYPPLSTIAGIFVELADLKSTYSWYAGNCFWFAGSVWESIKDLATVTVQDPAQWPSRGEFLGARVGSDYNNVGHGARFRHEKLTHRVVREAASDAADPPELEEERSDNLAVQEAIPESQL
ncbi:hypothetical protein L218DRAFT_1032145 [Marasmius fiardii PR-910]|nr:hypothetical protein L218DRAFT_1032145 [Marasmius fiardii PR-910]